MVGETSTVEAVRESVSDERVTSVRRMWPAVGLVTGLVAVLPIAAVYWLRRQGVLSSFGESVAFAVVFALVTVRAASMYWQRRKPGADLMFSELLLWGWLRRLRLESELRDASRLLADVGPHGPQQPSDRDAAAAVVARVVDAFQALDGYTAGHSRRVARMATCLAQALGLPSEEVNTIRAAAAVHDVGKLRVPAEILNKPGFLSLDEYELVKRHAVEGAAIVSALGDDELTSIVRHHHERLDGTGYPDGLAGDQIPIGARVIAVVDTYDAIIAARPYRPAEPHKLAMHVLMAAQGTQFDPEVVRAFVRSYAPRRAVLWFSGLGLAAVRVFAWARVGGRPMRPSPPLLKATNASAVGGLAAVAAVAAAVAAPHPRAPSHPVATPAAAVASVLPGPTPRRSRPANRRANRRATVPSAALAPTTHTPLARAPVVNATRPNAPSIGMFDITCGRLSTAGGRCMVKWSVSHARVCTLSVAPALPGQLPATVACGAGRHRELRLPANPGGSTRRWTLILAATGAAGTNPARRQTVVAVPAAAPAPDILALSARCGTLPPAGGICTVRWQARHAATCTLTATPELVGQLPATVRCGPGVRERDLRLPANATAATASWTLTLTATGASDAGAVRRQTTILVAGQPRPQPSIGSLILGCTVLPAQGGPCPVSWTVAHADTCTLTASPALTGQLPVTVDCSAGTGQLELRLPANTNHSPQTWTVTLVAAAIGGATPASRHATIIVAAQPPDPEILSLSAACTGTPGHGQDRTCTVQWSVRNARVCDLAASPALVGQLPISVDCTSGAGQARLELPGRIKDGVPRTWTLTLTAIGVAGTSPASQQTTIVIERLAGMRASVNDAPRPPLASLRHAGVARVGSGLGRRARHPGPGDVDRATRATHVVAPPHRLQSRGLSPSLKRHARASITHHGSRSRRRVPG